MTKKQVVFSTNAYFNAYLETVCSSWDVEKIILVSQSQDEVVTDSADHSHHSYHWQGHLETLDQHREQEELTQGWAGRGDRLQSQQLLTGPAEPVTDVHHLNSRNIL